MKVILFLFTLLNFSLSWGQDAEVERAVDSIIKRGLEKNIDLRPLLEAHLDTIVIWEPEQFHKPKTKKLSSIFGTAKYLGLRKGKYYYEIRISRELLSDFKVLERVIAHEIGHTLGLVHCCEEKGSKCADSYVCLEIMSLGHITDEENHPFFYNEQWRDVYWENYFNLIREKKKL